MATRGEVSEQSALLEPEPRELAAIVQGLRRHLRLGFRIVLACLALAAASLLLPKFYTADATLAYDPQTPLSKGGGGVLMTDAQRDSEIDAQLAQVASLAVAEDVARSVDLSANPWLRREADAWAASSDRPLSRDEALGTALLDHVKARRVGQTPDFTISFTAATAEQAARIANSFAASYLEAAVRQKSAPADASAHQLYKRIGELRAQANLAESDLAAFRLANNLLNNPDATVQEQEIATLRGQLADARGQAALAGARSAVADPATVVGGGAAGSVDTSSVSALTQQRGAAAADLAALLGRHGEKHPDVIAARKKMAELDAQLSQAMQGNRASATVEARGAGARAQALAGSLTDAEGHLAATLGHQARLLDLENSALAARQAYQDALKIGADQTAQRALVQPDAEIIALAVPPLRPKFPRLGINLLVGLLVGLTTAVAVAFIRESWLHTLGSVEDIARWLDSDYFAPLPLLARRRKAVTRDPAEAVLLDPNAAFARSMRSLASTALFAARKRGTSGGRVIGITSALPGEGRTSVSIAMGRQLAASGMKVALIAGAAADRGGGKPKRRSLVAEVASGWPDGVDGGAGVDAVGRVDGAGLVLFGEGAGAHAAEPVLDDHAIARMIAGLRADYEVVIIDAPPILGGDASPPLFEAMDAVVLLARWRATPVRSVREAIRRIVAAGGQVTGVALSMVEGIGG